MRKMLALLIVLSLMLPANAFSGPLVSNGAVTRANMRISAVAGTAFVDFSSAGSLTPYVSYTLHVVDSAGKKLIGTIAAVGSGETLGSEILSNPTFDDNTTGWNASSCTIASSHPTGGGQSDDYCILTMTSGAYQYMPQEKTISIGTLLKGSVYSKSGSSGNEASIIKMQQGAPSYSTIRVTTTTTSSSWTLLEVLGTASSASTYIILQKNTATAGTMLFDEASLKQVLTPSTTGVTITNGSAQSWTSQESGFNYNDASNYTYFIYADRHMFLGAGGTATLGAGGTMTIWVDPG